MFNVKGPKSQVDLLSEFYDTVFRPDNEQPIPTLPIPLVMMGQIVKKGDPEDVVNYLPASFISVECMVFERNLKRAILSNHSECDAITGCQHGFLPCRPCPPNPPILEETITRLMDDGNTVDVVYLDCAKAVNAANHRFLLASLEPFGMFEKIDQVLSDEKNLQSASGRCVVAEDKDQERGTSGANDRATSIHARSQPPPSVIDVITQLLADYVNMVLPRSRTDLFAEPPLQCL